MKCFVMFELSLLYPLHCVFFVVIHVKATYRALCDILIAVPPLIMLTSSCVINNKNIRFLQLNAKLYDSSNVALWKKNGRWNKFKPVINNRLLYCAWIWIPKHLNALTLVKLSSYCYSGIVGFYVCQFHYLNTSGM